MALSVPECIASLSGYPLTDEERANPVALLAGYCRLLGDVGLIEDNHATELAAVKAVASRIIGGVAKT